MPSSNKTGTRYQISTMSQPTASPSASTTPFTFPPHYSFPPFFTLQPNPLTRSSQLASWSALILAYCRHHRLFTLTTIDAIETPLFKNTTLNKQLSLQDAREVLSWMAGKDGGERVEWIGAGAKSGGSGRCWVYWRRPEEWAGVVESWVCLLSRRFTVIVSIPSGTDEWIG